MSATDPLFPPHIDAALAREAQVRTTAFDHLVTTLADAGVTARITTTAVPIQIEGTLADGAPFYFRARGDTASLEVWPVGSDPHVDAEQRVLDFARVAFAHEVVRWAWPEAGWLSADEVAAVLGELIDAYARATST